MNAVQKIIHTLEIAAINARKKREFADADTITWVISYLTSGVTPKTKDLSRALALAADYLTPA